MSISYNFNTHKNLNKGGGARKNNYSKGSDMLISLMSFYFYFDANREITH